MTEPTQTHTPTHTDVAIIGAGFAGIGMAIQLRREGLLSFRIFERANRVGGTWRDNTYPGVACDVPAHLYSFSFLPNPNWSAMYAPGQEIADYLAHCVAQERLDEHLLLETEVEHAEWDDAAHLWHLHTSSGIFTAGSLVVGAGRLTEPRIPAVPGVQDFAGDWFHSARWNHNADLTDKRIAVIGSGASAIQIIPELSRVASELIVLQRSAPYVIPREEHTYSAAERRRFAALPHTISALREQLFWRQEEVYVQRVTNTAAIARAREVALEHLRSTVERKELVDLLTPSYEIGCKRILLSNEYYQTFNEPHVRLHPHALKEVSGHTLTATDGTAFEVDVIVYATGFVTQRQPYARRVVGRDGLLLSEAWAKRMRGYASTTVPGFPNLYVLNGPNAGLGHSSAIYMIETQVNYVLEALQFQRETRALSLEVTAAAEAAYVDELDEVSANTVWLKGGCVSWYTSESDTKLTLLWPDFAHEFRQRNEHFSAEAYDITFAPDTVGADGTVATSIDHA